MHSRAIPLTPIGTVSRWNGDDELTHIEDTLRSESLNRSFEHLIDGCTCSGKLCRKCLKMYCHHGFRRDKCNRDGLYGYCRTCQYITRQNSRARRRGSPATLTMQQWLDLKAYYCHRCVCCGKQEPEITLTMDHILPIAQGGPSSISNIQPLCLTCNKKKGNTSTDFRTLAYHDEGDTRS